MKIKARTIILLVVIGIPILFGCENILNGGDGGALLKVSATVDMAVGVGILANAQIFNNSTPVTNATVTVNGKKIPYVESIADYHGSIPPVNAGESLSLNIKYKLYGIHALLVMPQPPTITAPTTGTYDASTDLLVQWNMVSPMPDYFVIGVGQSHTSSSTGYFATVSGSSTSHTIPANTLKPSISNIRISVRTVNFTTSLGPYVTSDSSFAVVNGAYSESFSTQ